MKKIRFFCGLDVAAMHDASALAICTPSEDARSLSLVYLDRWWLDYPSSKRRLSETFSAPPLKERCLLVVDSTGPGLGPYQELLLDSVMQEVVGEDRMWPLTITSGAKVRQEDGHLYAGKRSLIASLHTAMRRGEFVIPDTLPLYSELMTEFAGFEATYRKGSGSIRMGNNSRVAKYDDLITACGLAIMAARLHLSGSL